VHQQHRNSNLTQFEIPGCGEGDVIIDPAIPALLDSLAKTIEQVGGEIFCEHCDIDWAQK
jgi:hypothetical protein